MATQYQVINVKQSKGNFNGVEYNNVVFLCFCSDSAASKYVLAGEDTANLKMRYDDYAYVIRARNYTPSDLVGKDLSPVFDRNGNMSDFVVSDPSTGEVQ